MLLFYRWIPSGYNMADDDHRMCVWQSCNTKRCARGSVCARTLRICCGHKRASHRDCAAVGLCLRGAGVDEGGDGTPGTHAIGAPPDQELLGPLANIRTCIMVSLCENRQSPHVVPGDSGLSLPQSKVVNSHTIDSGRLVLRDLEELRRLSGPLGLKLQRMEQLCLECLNLLNIKELRASRRYQDSPERLLGRPHGREVWS